MRSVVQATSNVFLAACHAVGGIRVGANNAGLGFSRDDTRLELARQRSSPVKLARPVVVLNGYHAPPLVSWLVSEALARQTSGAIDDFLAVSYAWHGRIDAAASRATAAVEARWPSRDAEATIEVDVIGISMGGIVARWAALPSPRRVHPERGGREAHPKRLKIASLYTLATPHAGARMADLFRPDPAARDLRAGSALLALLDAHDEAFETVSYTQERDRIVGATRAAPPGRQPIWTHGPLAFGHFLTAHNPWIAADLARRLRGETPMLRPAGPPSRD